MYNHVIIGMAIYVEPYEQIMQTPIKQRHGIVVNGSMASYPLAAPYEDKIPELKNRDKTKIERVFVKWNNEYSKAIENMKYGYILY